MRLSGLMLISASLIACFGPSNEELAGGKSGSGGKPGTGGSIGGGAGGQSGAGGCMCAPVAPAGWTGPFALYDGSSGSVPQSCPAPFDHSTLVAYADLEAISPATCDPKCSCGNPTAGTCAATTTVHTFDAYACNFGCESTFPIGQSCLAGNAGTCSTINRLSVDAPVASGGSCAATPSAPTPTIPSFGWKRTAFACSALAQTGQCSKTSVCVPAPPLPFQSNLCIYHDGDEACPGAPYSTKATFYKQGDDTRGCSPCACSAPAGMTCSGVVKVASGATGSCTNMTQGAFGQCFGNTFNGVFVQATWDNVPTGGSCAPSGGTPVGTVAPAGQVTVCCM